MQPTGGQARNNGRRRERYQENNRNFNVNNRANNNLIGRLQDGPLAQWGYTNPCAQFGNNIRLGNDGNRMGGMNMAQWGTQNAGGGQYNNNLGQGQNMNMIHLASNLVSNLIANRNAQQCGGAYRGAGNMAALMNSVPIFNYGNLGNRLNNVGGQGGYQNNNIGQGARVTYKKAASGAIRKQNNTASKKVQAKNGNKLKDNVNAEDERKSSLSYSNIPNNMFYCHLCKIPTWDANSFESHINGRPHLLVRESIEEGYRLKANIFRQEAKIAEQFKEIEFDQMKKHQPVPGIKRHMYHCNMCELNYRGPVSLHRKSQEHLQLKKFLHPKCADCDRVFSFRYDYDTHLLTASHLRKAAKNKNPKSEERKKTDSLINLKTQRDEMRDVRQSVSVKKKPNKKENVVDKKLPAAATETAATTDVVVKEVAQEKPSEETEEVVQNAEVVDAEDVIFDYAEGDKIPIDIEPQLPKYKADRGVALSFIRDLHCYECRLCGTFFDSKETSVVHSRTQTHHRNFVKFLNEKSNDNRLAQKRANAAENLKITEQKNASAIKAGAAAAAAAGACAETTEATTDSAESDNTNGNSSDTTEDDDEVSKTDDNEDDDDEDDDEEEESDDDEDAANSISDVGNDDEINVEQINAKDEANKLELSKKQITTTSSGQQTNPEADAAEESQNIIFNLGNDRFLARPNPQ